MTKNKQQYTFLIESSASPIYQRISKGFKEALEKQGHKIIYFNPSYYSSKNHAIQSLLSITQEQKIDYCFIFSNSLVIKSYYNILKSYVFEILNVSLIFIHHDCIGHSLTAGNPNFYSYFDAIYRLNDKSWHFCIERHNIIDLKLLGIKRVFHIFHASEFTNKINSNNHYNVSFVGHVLPDFGEIYKSNQEIISFSSFHHVSASFWNRITNLDFKIKQSAHSYAVFIGKDKNNINTFKNQFEYIYLAGMLSPHFRGEIINKLKCSQIDIVGGDPGYISGIMDKRMIQKNGVIYHPPTQNYIDVNSIYANSKINLNITSLQFDDAVVNRVIDVGAAGGFILTDWKSDLRKITSVHEEISYKTIEELNYKIDYYLFHEKERLEIAQQLHEDIKTQNSYEKLVNYIISKITRMNNYQTEQLRLDLGCGPRKTEGFVGVDIYDWEGVDVVADLTQRFPFPDDSVDEIRAYDIIEHLPDRLHTMNEIWRICKPEAIVDILVPSTDGRGAFQDPTHVSFWNINSFKYYSLEFPSYLDLCKSYGFQGEYKLVSLSQQESGDEVIHVRAILKVIKQHNKNENYLEDLLNQLTLRKVNILISIDWSQQEETIIKFLGNILVTMGNHPDRKNITLLIDISNLPKDHQVSPEEIISDIALTLILEENLDILNEGVEVTMFPLLTKIQWQTISSKICGRIQWDCENADTIASLEMENMELYDLQSLSSKKIFQVDRNTWTLR
ncbi:MAG: glycosyltransferase [Symploca sp. SIO1C2]|nr:glycosyltransferase [Symploca sp. SIO1C2]